MSGEEYIGELLKHSDQIDVGELKRALEVARYARPSKAIKRAVSSEALDRVHSAWRALDGWINTAVDRRISPWLTQCDYLEFIAKKAKELATEAERIEAEEAKIARLLWDMVITLSNPKWINRFICEAESQYFSYLTRRLLAVRQACKCALVMLEFKAEYDIVTERF